MHPHAARPGELPGLGDHLGEPPAPQSAADGQGEQAEVGDLHVAVRLLLQLGVSDVLTRLPAHEQVVLRAVHPGLPLRIRPFQAVHPEPRLPDARVEGA